MFQGLVGLGGLELALLFLCQLCCPADVPFPELPARGVQPCDDFLGIMLGLQVV